MASAYNHVAIIEYLLKKGAKIEKRDRDNFTPLLLAAAEGNAEAVEVLLQHGADIYAQDREDRSVLYWASKENHVKAAEVPSSSFSCEFRSKIIRKLSFQKVLLQDPRAERLLDACDRYDNSPLHMAALQGFLGIAVALLEAGGDVDNKNEDEQTPLHLAAKEVSQSIEL